MAARKTALLASLAGLGVALGERVARLALARCYAFLRRLEHRLHRRARGVDEALQLLLADVAEADQRFTEAPPPVTLIGERRVQLEIIDDPGLLEDFAQLEIFLRQVVPLHSHILRLE